MHLSWLICITKSKLVSEESALLTSVSHWSFSGVAVLKSKMTSRSGLGGSSCPLCAQNRRDRIWRLTWQVQLRRQICLLSHQMKSYQSKGPLEGRGVERRENSRARYGRRVIIMVPNYLTTITEVKWLFPTWSLSVKCAEQLCPVWRLFSPLWGLVEVIFSGILSEHPTDYNVT